MILVFISAILVAGPFLALKGAEFGGSDDAGSVMVDEIQTGYEAWFEPVLEAYLGGEIPGEIESLIFCLQTAIGVSIIAYFMGKWVERKKWTDKYGENAIEKVK